MPGFSHTSPHFMQHLPERKAWFTHRRQLYYSNYTSRTHLFLIIHTQWINFSAKESVPWLHTKPLWLTGLCFTLLKNAPYQARTCFVRSLDFSLGLDHCQIQHWHYKARHWVLTQPVVLSLYCLVHYQNCSSWPSQPYFVSRVS